MKAYSKTDIGSKRTMNQDSVYCNENSVGSFQNLFIVADGMGGHKAGDYASRLCVEKMVYAVEQSKSITPVTILEEAVTEANKGVLEEAKANAEYEGMGTTMVACTLQEDTLYCQYRRFTFIYYKRRYKTDNKGPFMGRRNGQKR